MPRVEQLNQLLLRELAQTISREIRLDGVLITITQVDCSSDLRRAKVFVSVLPDKYFGTALKVLRQKTGLCKKSLSKLNLKFMPRLIWQVDPREKKAAELEEVFKQL